MKWERGGGKIIQNFPQMVHEIFFFKVGKGLE